MKNTTYIIHDWAGNHLFQDQEFGSYDDGWAFIQDKFPNATEEELEDYWVIPKPEEGQDPIF